MKTLISNIRIIEEDALLPGHSVLIEDGRIARILPEAEKHSDIDEVVDGGNGYLSPGFIDIHNHGNSGFDAMDASFEALEKMAAFHLGNGVTSFCATTMTNPYEKITAALSNAAAYRKRQSKETSEMIGVYLEGPYFSPEKKGAQPLKDIRLPDMDGLKSFIASSEDSVRVVSLAPELRKADEMIRFLKGMGIRIAIGHSNAEYRPAKEAIDSGATLSTHLYNGMRSFSHRDGGIIGACLTDDRLFTEIIADGIHLSPEAVDIAKRCKGSDRIVLISDAMRAAGLPDGVYELGGQTVISKDNHAVLEDGTLAGSTLNLRQAVKNMIDLFDTDLVDAVKMASLNPARALGIDDEKGSVAAGKTADLLIFDETITIKHVLKNGITVR